MNKRVLVLMILMTLLVLPLTGLAEGRGYDTPEACATAMFEAMMRGDAEQMEACFAFDELARSFDYERYCERLNAVMPEMLMPANNEMNICYNRSRLQQSWWRRFCGSATVMAVPEAQELFFSGRALPLNVEENAEIMKKIATTSYADLLTLCALGTLQTPESIPSVADMYTSAQNQKNMARNMACWGVETYCELGINLTCGPIKLMLPMRFVQFDGKWLADPNVSTLGLLMKQSSLELCVIVQD